MWASSTTLLNLQTTNTSFSLIFVSSSRVSVKRLNFSTDIEIAMYDVNRMGTITLERLIHILSLLAKSNSLLIVSRHVSPVETKIVKILTVSCLYLMVDDLSAKIEFRRFKYSMLLLMYAINLLRAILCCESRCSSKTSFTCIYLLLSILTTFFLRFVGYGFVKLIWRKKMNLLRDPLLQTLFTHDIVLVGSVVRESLAGTPLESYVRDGTVVGRAFFKQWLTINRLLHNKMVSMTVENETHLNIVALFLLKWKEGIDMRLRMSFRKNVMSTPASFPRLDVDVNTLCLSRNGLFVDGSIFEKEPVPLARLWHQCTQRQFRLATTTPFNDAKWNTQRIQSLVDQGWEYLDAAVRPAAAPYPKDICCICRESFEGTVLVTTCNHYFHTHCWKEHAMSRSTAFSFTPLKVHCPLCREEFLPWQTLV